MMSIEAYFEMLGKVFLHKNVGVYVGVAGVCGRGIFVENDKKEGDILLKGMPIASYVHERVPGSCLFCYRTKKWSCPRCMKYKDARRSMLEQFPFHSLKSVSAAKRFPPLIASMCINAYADSLEAHETTTFLLTQLIYPRVDRTRIPVDTHMKDLAQLKSMLAETLGDEMLRYCEANFLTDDWYLTTVGRLGLNSFRHNEMSALYTGASLINHSCFPNSRIDWDYNEIRIIAKRDLKADEQVFISYIDIENHQDGIESDATHRYLMSAYNINCRRSCTCGKGVEMKVDDPTLQDMVQLTVGGGGGAPLGAIDGSFPTESGLEKVAEEANKPVTP